MRVPNFKSDLRVYLDQSTDIPQSKYVRNFFKGSTYLICGQSPPDNWSRIDWEISEKHPTLVEVDCNYRLVQVQWSSFGPVFKKTPEMAGFNRPRPKAGRDEQREIRKRREIRESMMMKGKIAWKHEEDWWWKVRERKKTRAMREPQKPTMMNSERDERYERA